MHRNAAGINNIRALYVIKIIAALQRRSII